MVRHRCFASSRLQNIYFVSLCSRYLLHHRKDFADLFTKQNHQKEEHQKPIYHSVSLFHLVHCWRIILVQLVAPYQLLESNCQMIKPTYLGIIFIPLGYQCLLGRKSSVKDTFAIPSQLYHFAQINLVGMILQIILCSSIALKDDCPRCW